MLWAPCLLNNEEPYRIQYHVSTLVLRIFLVLKKQVLMFRWPYAVRAVPMEDKSL
jgi:hypothetical protein